jgi:hypothetical protein
MTVGVGGEHDAGVAEHVMGDFQAGGGSAEYHAPISRSIGSDPLTTFISAAPGRPR